MPTNAITSTIPLTPKNSPTIQAIVKPVFHQSAVLKAPNPVTSMKVIQGNSENIAVNTVSLKVKQGVMHKVIKKLFGYSNNPKGQPLGDSRSLHVGDRVTFNVGSKIALADGRVIMISDGNEEVEITGFHRIYKDQAYNLPLRGIKTDKWGEIITWPDAVKDINPAQEAQEPKTMPGITKNDVGGIDFDPQYLQLNMQGDGGNVPVPSGFEWLLREPIRGFIPQILKIQSGLGSSLAFLGDLVAS
jgi:hypothetical protein